MTKVNLRWLHWLYISRRYLGYFGQTLDQTAKREPVILLKMQKCLNSKFKLDVILEDDLIPVLNSVPTAWRRMANLKYNSTHF